MGKGSSQSASNVHNDNDVMASDGSVVMGEGASYDNIEYDIGMGATMLAEGATNINKDVGMGGTLVEEGASYQEIELGMGATMLGDGAIDQSGNEGMILGDGAEINNGVKLGDGASYAITTMDDNTAGLLDNAMTLMYASTENVLEAHAAQIGTIDEPTFMNPTTTSAVGADGTTSKMSGKAKLGAGAVGAALLIALALASKGKKK